MQGGGGGDPWSPKTIPNTFLPPKTHDHLAYFGNTHQDYFSKIAIRLCVRSMAAIFESRFFKRVVLLGNVARQFVYSRGIALGGVCVYVCCRFCIKSAVCTCVSSQKCRCLVMIIHKAGKPTCNRTHTTD